MRTKAKGFDEIKKKANLPNDFRPFHGYRHVFASLGVSNGITLYEMQHLLTHATGAMTQRYAHLENDNLKQASSKISGLIFKKAEAS